MRQSGGSLRQSRTVPSSLDDAIVFPSGEYRTMLTQAS
jgi:hypothetical protein